MTERDRLRSMLDERGVEYRVDDASYTFATHWTDSLGRGCSFVEEVYDGESKTIFVSEPSAHNITPEQAIAATLGRPKVKKVRGTWDRPDGGEFEGIACSGCGEWIDGDLDCIGEMDGPNFCHNCGGEFDGPLLCKRCGNLADEGYGEMCAKCYYEEES